MVYSYKNKEGKIFFLHGMGSLWYFSISKSGASQELPKGYHVIEGKTGLPMLKKK